MRGIVALCAVGCASSCAFAAINFGPSAYFSSADSPFLGSPGFVLEDFEDGLLNIAGVTGLAGGPYGPDGLTDSVDGDNGPIDGSGTSGRSYFSSAGSAGVQFVFNLDALPQRAGIVWTDGSGIITFQAFDAANQLITSFTGNHADFSNFGTTNEDRFYGVEYAAGIASIKISNSSGGIEVDHLQYAYIPSPAGLMTVGVGLLVGTRRRR